MVKAKGSKGGAVGGYNTMEKTMKNKKRKGQPAEKGSDLLLLPSVVDPSLEVPVPRDHRVNLDKVLDEGMFSQVLSWSKDASFPVVDDSRRLEDAESAVGKKKSGSKSPSNNHVDGKDTVVLPPGTSVGGSETDLLPSSQVVKDAPDSADGDQVLPSAAAVSLTPAVSDSPMAKAHATDGGKAAAKPPVFFGLLAAKDSLNSFGYTGALPGGNGFQTAEGVTGEPIVFTTIGARSSGVAGEVRVDGEKPKGRRSSKRHAEVEGAHIPTVPAVSFGSFNGLTDPMPSKGTSSRTGLNGTPKQHGDPRPPSASNALNCGSRVPVTKSA